MKGNSGRGGLDLTPELIARVHRTVEDAGPDPDILHHTEEDYDRLYEDFDFARRRRALPRTRRSSGLEARS